MAEKYQTGVDQPKLHTMFVDKKLTGLKAVQTLSRLNRTYPGKEDTFVLDFVNDSEDIQKAFQVYYEDTALEGGVEPKEQYTLENDLKIFLILNSTEIKKFVEVFYKKRATSKDTSWSNNFIDGSHDRYRKLQEEDQREFLCSYVFTPLSAKLRRLRMLSCMTFIYTFVFY